MGNSHDVRLGAHLRNMGRPPPPPARVAANWLLRSKKQAQDLALMDRHHPVGRCNCTGLGRCSPVADDYDRRTGLRIGAFRRTFLRRNRRPRSHTAAQECSCVSTTTRLISFGTVSHTGVPVRIVAAMLVCLFGSLVGCTSESVNDQSQAPTSAASSIAEPSEEPSEEAFVPFDVRPLLKPARKYFGAALDGAPTSLGAVKDFTTKVGKQPNMLLYYTAWGDQFDAKAVKNAHAIGALPVMAWEPFEPSVVDIADGASDDYIRKFAAAVQALNLPVAISWAHEMNGFWYPWGTKKTSPTDLVRAWRHIHNTFLDVGASNVIWVWSPNVINSMRQVPLKPLYPGDSYVDWIGVVGYYEDGGARTFSTLFGPTKAAVRRFTTKPILIFETGAEDSWRKRKDIADLFRGVAASHDVIGFNWFNYAKRADWRIDSDPSALAQFKKYAKDDRYGFDLNHP